jgi:hypothetical protein
MSSSIGIVPPPWKNQRKTIPVYPQRREERKDFYKIFYLDALCVFAVMQLHCVYTQPFTHRLAFSYALALECAK